MISHNPQFTGLPIVMFARAHARRNDPHTSKEAARRAESFAASQSGRILAALKKTGPATAKELEAPTGLTNVQITRRTKDMERDGLIKLTGIERDGFNEFACVDSID